MVDIYRSIEQRLEKLDFNSIFPKFHRYPFALYDGETVYFENKTIKQDDRFIGNTTIDFDGRQIAIWNMDYPVDDLDVFTSEIVHEMFHAFQIENHEDRFPDEFSGLSYNYDARNIAAKIEETKNLVLSYRNKSKPHFDSFLSLRKWRLLNFVEELKYESGIEAIEGTARYVELRTLKQLSSEKADAEIEGMLSVLSRPENFLPIRKISYDIGALILLTGENHSDVRTEARVEETDILKLDGYNKTKMMADRFLAKNRQRINHFLKMHTESTITGKIVGFDPMNTIKSGTRLLFEHFVRIETTNGAQNIFGTSVAVLENGFDSVRLYN